MGKSRSSITGLQHKRFVTHGNIGYPHPDIIYPCALGKMLELWEEKKMCENRQEGCQEHAAFPLFKITTFEKT